MTQGQGFLTRRPAEMSRRMFATYFLWLGSMLVLGAWWVTLVFKQADRIHDLEVRLGLSASEAAEQWHRTQRMLMGEGIFFFAILLLSAGAMTWFYLRDMRRQKSLQGFFAGVTHELRTPLTGIRLQAESLALKLEGSENSHRLIQRLLEDVARLESQVERTLELARVEGGGPLALKDCQLVPWLARFFRNELENRSRDLRLDSESLARIGSDPIVQVDEAALSVVLRNVVENSVRHSGKRPVTLQLEWKKEGPLRGMLFVSDNGNGFSGDPSQLLALFSKGDRSTGAGVGLYLGSQLMIRMGGALRIVQQESGFTIALEFKVSG
jgi:signal transduction histidine kinase